jgi:ATP-dependent Clp protease, protease subunit
LQQNTVAMKKFVIDGQIGEYYFSKSYVREMLKGSETEVVEVNVSSLGGSVDHALDINDQFAKHGNIIIDYTGLNASSATIFSMGAKKVRMSENSFYLIHKPMYPVDEWGNMNEDDIEVLITSLEKKKMELAKFTLVIARMYKDKTGLSINEVLNLMKEQTWLTADMAKEKGLVDEVYKPSQIVNYLDDSSKMAMIAASGYPVPPRIKPVAENTDDKPEAYNETKLINKLRKIFNPINTMKKQFVLVNSVLGVEKLEATADGIFLNEKQLEAIEAKIKADSEAIAAAKPEEKKEDTKTPEASKGDAKPGDDSKPTVEALTAEIVTLKADLAEIRKNPGAAPATTKVENDNLDTKEDINAKLENMTMAERIEFLSK